MNVTPAPPVLLVSPLLMGSGTLNEDKNAALQRALMRLPRAAGVPVPGIVATDQSSGVDEQPEGAAMSALGAENRAIGSIRSARAKGYDVDYGCGAESKLEFQRGFCVDTATIVVVHRTKVDGEEQFRTVALATSLGVPIPVKHMVAAMQRGLRTTTAGSLWARAVPGVNGKNWHAHVTHGRLERGAILEDAYFAALCQVW
jgi:non-canonical (house-cleaning) NTP pyrophosphatase